MNQLDEDDAYFYGLTDRLRLKEAHKHIARVLQNETYGPSVFTHLTNAIEEINGALMFEEIE